MKKLLFIVALGFLAAGCNQTSNTAQNQTNQPTPTPAPTSSTQTYSNQTYGFEFTYSNDMQFVTPTYPLLQDKVVQVQTQRNAYPNTNFGDAAFGVSAQYAKSLQNCLEIQPPPGGDGFKTKVNINGTDFYMTSSNGAAAGNRYDSKVYRALVGNQTCIELNETIHTANIGNYPSGTVSEVNTGPIWQKLDSILNSFKLGL